jgi:amiloride-sensitive sodium channel
LVAEIKSKKKLKGNLIRKDKKCKCGLYNSPEIHVTQPDIIQKFEPPINEPSNIEYFTEQSSIHGIRFLSKRRNNNFSRIFWSLSLIMSLFGLIYNGKRLYIKLNVSPDIGTSVKQELSNQIPFPAITVCMPLFAKSGLANLSHYIEEYHKNGKMNVLNLTETEKKYLTANAMRCGNNRLFPLFECCKNANISNVVQLMEESSPKIDEIFTTCSANFTFMDCSKMFKRILTHNGFCYTTNMQDFDTIFNDKALSEDFKIYMKQMSSKVEDHTIHWTLDHGYKNDSISNVVPLRLTKANIHNIRVFSTLDDVNNKCGLSDIEVILHLPNEIPTYYHHEYEFEHSHSERLVLSAKVTRAHESLRNYPPQLRGCYFSDEKKLHFFKVYTRNHCYLECFTNHVLEKCGCVAFHMPRNASTEICDLDNGMCLHSCIYRWPLNDNMADGKTPCECYPTCNYIEYSVQEIDTVYDSARNMDIIKNYSTE